jgi:glycogen debranching enzyme
LTKKDALAEARRVLRNRVALLNRQVQDASATIAHKLKLPKSVDLAYECARNALDSLTVADEGLYAGIPWFYQFWVRDESVSCGALRSLGRKKLVKKILQRHLAKFGKDALPFAFYGHSLRTVDGPGWVALRYAQSKDLFVPREQKKSEAALRNAFHALTHDLRDGLVTNGPLETWMDTDVDGRDAREGARIEVQALTLALARALGEKEFEWQLARRVRETFWNGSYLHDGLGDPTIRPNVFIAAYAYPDLLTKSEWEKCFDAVLPKLWLSWGGLSGIDTSHELFTDHYTGQDNVSYHRGDSWFWLNNLAALVMHRVNARKYKKYVDRVLEASSHEITSLGALGHHAELSSARALSSRGCQSQAWSAAMFIELCEELFSQK